MKRDNVIMPDGHCMLGSHSLYAQSSKSDFMSDDKSLFEEVTGIKRKPISSISISTCMVTSI